MASIPNLNTLRGTRGGPRRRRGAGTPPSDGSGDSFLTDTEVEAAKDKVVQTTDNDASSSRMSAVALGYLDDAYAGVLFATGQEIPKRYPIINRGTYMRTQAIDELVKRFINAQPARQTQVVSLGAGSDTRFFRMYARFSHEKLSSVVYHELDFEANVDQKRAAIRNSPQLMSLIDEADKAGWTYRLNALDLRDLTRKSPPTIPDMDSSLPTLLLSECCLCYLPPEEATSVIRYFTMNLPGPLALILYEPVRPFDAFGKTMVSNLASRGIHLQTLKQYGSLEAQRQRLRIAGFTDGQGARDVRQLFDTEAWVASDERERVDRLEWLDEIEEWNLLASHYCVAWGWRGEAFGQAWEDLDGSRTRSEDGDGVLG